MLKKYLTAISLVLMITMLCTVPAFAAQQKLGGYYFQDGHPQVNIFVDSVHFLASDNASYKPLSNISNSGAQVHMDMATYGSTRSGDGGVTGDKPYIELWRKANTSAPETTPEYTQYRINRDGFNNGGTYAGNRNTYLAGSSGTPTNNTFKVSFDYKITGSETGTAKLNMFGENTSGHAFGNLFDDRVVKIASGDNGTNDWFNFEGTVNYTLSSNPGSVLSFELHQGGNDTDEGYVSLAITNIILEVINDGSTALSDKFIPLKDNETAKFGKHANAELDAMANITSPAVSFNASYTAEGKLKFNWENNQFKNTQSTNTDLGYIGSYVQYNIYDNNNGGNLLISVNSWNGTSAAGGGKNGSYILEDELGYADGTPYDFTVKAMDIYGQESTCSINLQSRQGIDSFGLFVEEEAGQPLVEATELTARKYEAVALVTNDYPADYDFTMLLALYKDGNLVKVDVSDKNVPTTSGTPSEKRHSMTIADEDINDPEAEYVLKAFAWESMTTLKPILTDSIKKNWE